MMLYIPVHDNIVIEVGMNAVLYGKGFGYPVRGLFIKGVEIFYKTEEDFMQAKREEIYGKTAAEWLARWDAGDTVWTISMGGLSPGYEQAIQIMVMETLRELIKENVNLETARPDEKKALNDRIDAALTPVYEKIGPSGAMVGSANNLAYIMYRRGPLSVFEDEKVKDRHIQVSK